MSAREENEFELVLGNKQLFSVLFVCVVLLGIFFAMGFIAGRNTGSQVSASSAAPAAPAPVVTESGKPAKEQTPAQPASSPSRQTPATLITEPMKTEAAPPKATPPPAAEPEKPAPGKYLQVAATSSREADTLLQLLRKQSFSGFTMPSRKDARLTAVLVGPFASNDAIATAREKLRQLNIDKPFAVEFK